MPTVFWCLLSSSRALPTGIPSTGELLRLARPKVDEETRLTKDISPPLLFKERRAVPRNTCDCIVCALSANTVCVKPKPPCAGSAQASLPYSPHEQVTDRVNDTWWPSPG